MFTQHVSGKVGFIGVVSIMLTLRILCVSVFFYDMSCFVLYLKVF